MTSILLTTTAAAQPSADGCIEELERIVRQIRGHWPKTRIHIRGDSGFCRESIMRWCEDNPVDHVPGLARNPRLVRAGASGMEAARAAHNHTGKSARRYRDLRCRTHKSWSRSRRVVGKAEVLGKGDNPRFVVTGLAPRQAAAKRLYEQLYCARGDMENRIKEQQLDLFADRTGSHTMRANRLRLYFASFAYVLMQWIRQPGARGTDLARVQCCTLRLKLLKVVRGYGLRHAGCGCRSPNPGPMRGSLPACRETCTRNLSGARPGSPDALTPY